MSGGAITIDMASAAAEPADRVVQHAPGLQEAAPITSARRPSGARKSSPKKKRRQTGKSDEVEDSGVPKRPKRQRTRTGEEVQRDIEIANVLNNLSLLAAVGTIDIHSMPRLAAPGLEAPDGWQWIEPPWDPKIKLSEPLDTLACLYNTLFLRVTYRMLSSSVARFRIYLIPQDVPGRRFFPQTQTIAKRRIKSLMMLINTAPEAWNGDIAAPFAPLIKPPSTGVPSLSDMFNQISAVPDSLPDLDDPETQEMIREVMTGNVAGMKSQLYQYQRETVAEMIRKELVPVQMIDPRLLEIVSPTGQTLYLDSDTYMVHLKPAFFDGIFGGVLSEEMGFGKTCICIALICATKYQGSRIPENCRLAQSELTSVQSLSSICSRTINSLGLPWQTYRASLPPNCLESLTRNRISYMIEDRRSSVTRTGTRGQFKVQTQTVVLSGTTLVVCPDSLVDQWRQELDKHVEKGYLSVLSYKGAPDRGELDFSLYDVVLMSQRRFSIESREPSSPLLKLRWKRMIVDEGHSMGASHTNGVIGAKSMYVDRKWAVTGTPVPGLLGINVGIDTAMTTVSPRSDRAVTNQPTKVANDLTRLGRIVADFLDLPPWSDNPGHWRKYCMAPFLDEHRHEIIDRVLKQVMVRHRWKDLEVDVKLPELTHQVVLLEPSAFNKININLFHAFIAVNAVSSDRTDQDYLFHRNNRAQLRRLVTNLQHSTFYWTGFSIDDVEFMLDVAHHCLTSGKAYSEADVSLLKTCVDAGRYAMSHRAWKFSSQFHEMGYFTSHIPPESQPHLFDIDLGSNLGVLSGPKVLYFQQLARAIKTRDADGNITDDAIVSATNEVAFAGTTAEQAPRSSVSPSKSKSQENEHRLRELPGVPSTPSPSHTSVQGKGFKYFSNFTEGFLNASAVRLSADSKYRNAEIVGTFSSKLSYLLSRILELCDDEKIIVFYEFDDVAFYLGEGLEILGVEHCFYTTSLSPQARSSNLMAFNATDRFRVMLMDLGLAAHGLNITGASRIFFVNPVWQPNIEAQAMRRAHRIGQTRPVHVETLVLKGTVEEEMFNRRRNMTQDEFAAAKTLTDDAPMSKIISKSHFLEIDGANPLAGHLLKVPVPLLKYFVEDE